MDSTDLGAGRLVMVVDSQPGSVLAMEHVLAGLGFRVTSAANRLDALARVERASASVILMDPFMPVMDWIMWQAKASTIALPPVVAVIDDARATTKAAADAAESIGAKAVLLKPFTTEHLAKVLAYALDDPVLASI